MKKLTAGIFTVLMGLCATSGADAAVASKGYVDEVAGANTTLITSLTQTVETNASTAAAATKDVADDLAGYKTTNDAAVKVNADAIAAAEQDIVALETTVNDETNGLVAKVATLQQDIENVQGGSLTLQDKSISKAKLDESLQAEIDSFQNADEVSGAIETALGDYTTTTDLNAALALKGDKTAVEKNAEDIAKNAEAIETNAGNITSLQGLVGTTAVATQISSAIEEANLSQYETVEGALAKYEQISKLKALAYKDTVGTADIDDKAVTTAKLADGAVDASKLGANAVTDAAVADGALSQDKINGLDTTLATKMSITNATSETGKYVFTANVGEDGVTDYAWELIERGETTAE